MDGSSAEVCRGEWREPSNPVAREPDRDPGLSSLDLHPDLHPMGNEHRDRALRTLAGRLTASGKSLVLCAEALRRENTVSEGFSVERHLLRTTARIYGLVREMLQLHGDPNDPDPVRAALERLIAKNGGSDLERVCRRVELHDALVELRGEGQVLPIPEVLGVVSTLHKSGMLWVESATENFLVQVSDGTVVFVQGDCPPPGGRIGEILVDRGFTNEAAIRGVLDHTDRRSNLFGKALLGAGIITAAHLKEALTFQAQQIFNRLFSAEEARFEFLTGMSKLIKEDIHLNVTQLLLESARLADESSESELGLEGLPVL